MTRGSRLVVFAGLVSLLALGATLRVRAQGTQQPSSSQPVGTAAISGTVLDGSTNAPIAGALVYLTSDTGRPLTLPQTRQVTDGRGRFAFVDLPGDAAYTLAASKFGFLDGGYGRDVSPTDSLRVIQLKPEAWVSNLRVPIWRPGSISGAVRDEAGEPVVGVFVRAFARFRIQGREDVVAGPVTTTNDRGEYRLSGLTPGKYVVQVPLVQAAVPSQTKLPNPAGNVPEGAIDIDETNRLVIGRYPLPPPAQGGKPMAYSIVFHPSSPTLTNATVIDLKFGDERPNVDLSLIPVPTVRVSGIVDGPPEALRSLTLRLLPSGLENAGLGSETASALVGPDGRFTFLNVPSGSYTIDAPVKVAELTSAISSIGGGPFNSRANSRLPVPPPAQGSGSSSSSIDLIPGLTIIDVSFRSGVSEYSGRVPVTVAGSDLNNVVVRLKPHLTFSGKIVIEPDPAKPNEKPPSRIPLRLDPAGGETWLGFPQSQFQQEAPPEFFTISGVKPGHYWLRTSGFPNWTVKSITWKGRDYAFMPFDTTETDDFSNITITVTNAIPELTGAVRPSNDASTETAMVVAFPVDRNQWRNTGLNPTRVRSATVSSAGTYRFATLPAGEYLVAAISRSLIAGWRDPEFLARLERVATRVSLAWGGRASQDLTMVGIK